MPFTNAPWSTPESNLTPEQFCRVCLVDLNRPRSEKIKAKCYLPVRSRPGSAFNRNAIRNALARLSRTKIPAEAKRRAARRLVRLAAEAGIQIGETIRRLAGLR